MEPVKFFYSFGMLTFIVCKTFISNHLNSSMAELKKAQGWIFDTLFVGFEDYDMMVGEN